MGRLALIGGHSILGSDPAAGFEPHDVETTSGPVRVYEHGDQVLLQRHGFARYTTAARIDHPRNFAALAELGCDRVLAIGSVGGLRAELGVGTFLCPDDFVALHLGLSLDDQHGGELVPGFHPEWRRAVVGAWGRVAEPELIDGGVYWNAIGPRFETPAEIRLIAAHADVIGMTIAAESIIAREMGIPYAAVCVVDNLANGIAAEQLSVAEFEAGKEENRSRLTAALGVVAAELERGGAG
ncbi:MAG TPA: MTAP family purine nucleoside phosphorylase [Solirubrobacterales bacterium]|nr:MTAP family purine nucleoside phosphorylase [Solirubrobacterales bacterium]